MSRFDHFDGADLTLGALCLLCGQYICDCESDHLAQAAHDVLRHIEPVISDVAFSDLDYDGIFSDTDLYIEEGDVLATLYDIAEPLATSALTKPAKSWTDLDRLALDIAHTASRILIKGNTIFYPDDPDDKPDPDHPEAFDYHDDYHRPWGGVYTDMYDDDMPF